MTKQQIIDLPIFYLAKIAVKTFFPETYARYRDTRDGNIRAMRSQGIALWNNELYEVIKKIIATSGVYVRSGPFSGMMFWPVGRPGYRAGGEAGSLLGLYELELHDVIAEIIARGYDQVIDIGCAEGYYAVGLAVFMPKARVYAFDIEASERELCNAMALVNNVADRVTVGAECTVATLRELTVNRCLIVSDCEGGEFELLRPDLVPGLADCDLLVELHDCFQPGLSEAVLPRFASTHQIDIIHTAKRDPNAFPELSFLTHQERQIALDERRPSSMTWAMMRSRNCSHQP